MSIALPAHLAPNAVRRSFVAAQHTVALTLLVITIQVSLVFQSAQPAAMLWPSLGALLPAAGLLFVARRFGVVLWSTAYLVVGGVGTYVYAANMLNQPIPVIASDGFSFLALKAALILVGGVVLGVRLGVVFAIAGFTVAEVAVALAQSQNAVVLPFDIPAFAFLVATIAAIVLIGFNSPRQLWILPSLQRAAHDEHLAGLRYRVEIRAATLMHDTVLNDLAAIAEAPVGRLSGVLQTQISRDVESLTSEEWLEPEAGSLAGGSVSARESWSQSELFLAVQESRSAGLKVSVTGDLHAISMLDRVTSRALGLAAKQCLVNVLKHSGVSAAEVAVYDTDSEVSVMVVDNGRGFAEETTRSDRLGLRSSVRKRIEIVGGTVNVWSTLGRGTSIMIKVPKTTVDTAMAREADKELP